MLVCYVPVATVGTVMVIAMMPGDLKQMAERDAEPDTIQLNNAMQAGIALPTYVQIIYVEDNEEFKARMNAWFEAAGAEATIDDFQPLDSLPKLYEKDETDE